MKPSENSADYLRLLNLINDLVLSVSLDGNELLYINAAAEEIYGQPVEAFYQQPKLWFQAVHPDDQPQLAEKFQEARNREVVHQPFRIVRPSGKVRWLQATIRCVYDAEQQPVSVGCIANDITGRVTTELALEEATAIYHSLVESLPINVFRKDAEGRFTFANQRYCDTLGYSYNEVIGKMDRDLYPQHLAEKFYNDDRWVLQTGLPFHDVQAYRTKTLNHCFVEVLKAPITDSDGRRIGIQGMFWDVTAQKQTEEALREAKDLAVSANQAKNDFLANISHEIRTPLNAVIGIADLLLDTPLDQNQREYLSMIQQSGESLLTLINDILDFSKMEAGKLQLDHRPFDIRDRLAECMRPLSLRSHEKELDFSLHVAPEVPTRIFGDLARLRQVLNNLVSNAIKFTETGGITVKVEAASLPNDHVALNFSVIDTGIGIPPEKLKSVFHEFEQVDSSTTRKYGGTGLGLAIASQLVELMQGNLQAESEVGKGSRFYFTLQCQVDPEESELEIPDVVAGTPILVIDDNEMNAHSVAETLSEWDLQVQVSHSTDDAIHQLADHAATGDPFQVAICNAALAKENDQELARWVRMQPAISETPFILLTSGGRIEKQNQRGGLRVRAQLFEPVKRADLLQAVLEVLDSSSEYSETSLLAPANHADATEFSRTLRLLLAEDNPVNQTLAVGLLEKKGHQVQVVDNGRDCVQALRSDSFDAVLMDIQMPLMDGLEATRQIREGEKQRAEEKQSAERTPIIAMTAHAMPEDEVRCREAGMDHYISKPIRASQLFDALRECVFVPAAATQEPEPTKTVTSNGPLIDWELAFDTVGGDRDLLRELLSVFLAEQQQMLEDVVNAIADGNSKEIRRTSHAIKGALLHLGARPAADIAKEIENNAEQGEPETLKNVWRKLEAACQQLIQPFRDFLFQLPQN